MVSGPFTQVGHQVWIVFSLMTRSLWCNDRSQKLTLYSHISTMVYDSNVCSDRGRVLATGNLLVRDARLTLRTLLGTA